MSKKRNQLLDTAKSLFWRYGINRVTIEEICSEANVSKMTFYNHFDNKNDIIKKILDKLYSDAMIEYRHIMDSDRKYKDKVADLYQLKLNATNEISHEFLNDLFGSGDEELMSFMNTKIQENLSVMVNDFISAQKKGEIRKDIKPEFINYFLNHMIKLGEDPELNSLYPSAQDMIMELLNFFFYGILPHSEKQGDKNE